MGSFRVKGVSKDYTNTETRRRRPNNGRYLVGTFRERGARPSLTISIGGAMLEDIPASIDVQSSSSSIRLFRCVCNHENHHFCTDFTSPGIGSSDESRGCEAPTDDGGADGLGRPTQYQRSPLRSPVGSVESDPQARLPDSCRGAGAIRNLASQPGVHRLPQQLRQQTRVHSENEPVWRSGEGLREVKREGEHASCTCTFTR